MAMMPPQKEIDTRTYSGLIAQRMRDLRTAKGWTVADLLDRVNQHLDADQHIALQTLHNWDRAKRKIDPDAYPAVAKAFGLTVRKFLPNE